MRRYCVTVVYRHKGSKYDRQATISTEATSVATAANRGIAEAKRRDRKNWREPEGSVFYATVTVGPRKEDTHAEGGEA